MTPRPSQNTHHIRLLGPWTAHASSDRVFSLEGYPFRLPIDDADFQTLLQAMGLLEAVDLMEPISNEDCGIPLLVKRQFKWPHAITPNERVAIEIQSNYRLTEIKINHHPVAVRDNVSEPVECFLQPNNELVLPLLLDESTVKGLRIDNVRLNIFSLDS